MTELRTERQPTTPTEMHPLFDTIAIPLASEEDAATTCRALGPFLSPESAVVIIHVIEKTSGGIDPAPVELRKDQASRIFDECTRELSQDAGTIDTTVVFYTDIVEGILEAASDNDADVIAFTPRSANRLLKLVSGDTAFKLIHRSDHPVLVIPPRE